MAFIESDNRAQPGPERRARGRPVKPLSSGRSRSLSSYMNEMGESHRLGPDEECALSVQIEESDLSVLRLLAREPRAVRALSSLRGSEVPEAGELAGLVERLRSLDQAAAEARARAAGSKADGTPCEEAAELEREASAVLRRLRVARDRLRPLASRLGRERPDLRAAERSAALARDRLVRANLRFVMYFASRFQGRGVPLADLVQEGNLGLMRAAEKFDRRCGATFATYSGWWIRQAVERAVVDQGRTVRIPQPRRDTIRRVLRSAQELSQRLGREPEMDELAAAMDMEPDEVRGLLDSWRLPISLEAPTGPEGELRLSGTLPDAASPNPEDEVAVAALAEDLGQALSLLTPREERVIRLRYGIGERDEHTLEQVGRRFEVTRQRAQQIEAAALRKLRDCDRSEALRSYLDG